MIFNNFIIHGIILKNKNGKKEILGLTKNWNLIDKSKYNNEDNFMVLTGKINNIIVIDLDNKDKDFSALKFFEENFIKLDSINTLVSKTINNGYHIFFKYTENIKNSVNNKINIDILSDGKGCVQGKNYDIINEDKIRELSEHEIEIINKYFSVNKINKELIKYDKEIIKYNKEYKKLNMLYNRPDNTEWKITHDNNVTKATSLCNRCLINYDLNHEHNEHCALFINKNKSVMKTCFSCGTEEVERKDALHTIKIFNVILNTKTEEETCFQNLQKDLIKVAYENEYRREEDTGIVYKKVKPYAYIKYKDPKKFLNEIFIHEDTFRSSINNMDNLIKFMKQYDTEEFPFLQYNEDYIGFSNGIFNIITCEFTKENNIQKDIIVKKYIDQEFNYSIETPLFDSVLKYQFTDEIIDFVYMCLGRLFRIRDNWGFMLYLLGEPGCGKSVILDIMCECFNNIGSIGETFEKKFGLSFLYDKDLIVCDDLPRNISDLFSQQTFQSCITSGKIPIAVKGGQGFTVEWNTPMLWAGNWFPDYIDKGQISRRIMTINFEKHVRKQNPILKKQILENELSSIIYKCLLKYNEYFNKYENKNVWDFCPEYFKEQQEELKMERNPLYKFLKDNTEYNKEEFILYSEIKERFSNYIGKKIVKLDNGTFYQVNPEYIIKQNMICKHCNNRASKKCCVKYKNSDRTSKKIIENISFRDCILD